MTDINLTIAHEIAHLPAIPRDQMVREIGRIYRFLGYERVIDLDAMNDFQVRQILEAARANKRDNVTRLRRMVARI